MNKKIMKMNGYEQELFAQRTPYLQWLKRQDAALDMRYGQHLKQGALGKQIHTLPFSSCMDNIQIPGELRDDGIGLFVREGGVLSRYAQAVFLDTFLASPDVVLAYADEDYRGSLGELYGIGGATGAEETVGAPWFKPDFSPDTLASFFYIGSVFAVRGSQILETAERYGSDISIYEMVCRIFMEAIGTDGIVHIPKVLYTNDRLADTEKIESSDKIRSLYEAGCRRQAAGAGCDKVSIVIPSKDHAEVLRKCLETLVLYTDYSCYEIIVVDNGSSPEQKMCITRMIEALRCDKPGLSVRYLYRESAFNFSAMCNAGARLAEGEHLLFLNDDIEIMDTTDGRQWLDRMLVYGRKSHVGAVGAKLYYPAGEEKNACYKIQHAGITNMGIGPAHKLCGMADEGCLYHGHNTQNYDMIAVTAACMLIRKHLFDSAGGFDENFPVAYNDVELCFRLYQQGYFNVQVNEAVLIHHESLSRGQDTSPEKRQRLSAEREKLYRKYPSLNARDPFYSPNLVQWKRDAQYNTGYLYAFDRQAQPLPPENSRVLFRKADIRNLLHAKCAPAAKLYDRLTGYHDLMLHIDNICYGDGIPEEEKADNNDNKRIGSNIMIEGWCAVRNADNAGLSRKLWLIDEGQDHKNVYAFDIAPKLREDVAALLEQDSRSRTRNTALSGIQVNIAGCVLKPGTYSVGVVCGNKLICDPQKYVVVPDEETGQGTKEKGL